MAIERFVSKTEVTPQENEAINEVEHLENNVLKQRKAPS